MERELDTAIAVAARTRTKKRHAEVAQRAAELCAQDVTRELENTTIIRTRSCDPNSVTGGSELCSLWTDTLAIRIRTYEMIWRSVPIHAVKTRQQFRSKSTSFHVSVCSCIISLLTIVSSVYICYLFYFK